MKTITEQDVLKAFYRFDCKKMPVLDINGSLTPSMDVTMHKKLCAEWLECFRGLETELFEKAAQIALERCKKYLRKERISAIIDAAKQGDFETARKNAEPFAKGAAEIKAYAKEIWPDASDVWIADNWLAIGMLYAQEKSCRNCGSARRCRTYGYRLTARNEKPEGEVITAMVPCYMRKAGKNENVQ